jgi:hypothetical protein
VDDWLAAQNSGNFSAYEKAYAARFTGVRRSGARVVRLSRAGWMKDRRRMFQKKMTVSVADVQIIPAGTGAVVTFEQTWASGSYKDVGRKRLVLAPEGGALRIVREEMLESKIVGAVAKSAPAAAGTFLFAFDGYVVLDAQPAADWATGAIEPGDLEGLFESAARKVDVAKLPEELRSWNGRRVRLFDFDRQICEASITGFRFVRRVSPHFSEKQEWKEGGASKKSIAKQVWALGEGGGMLLGTLDQRKACKDGKWARAGELPVPAIVSPEPAGPLEPAVLAAFRKLPAWQKMQKEFEADGRKGSWDEYDGASPEVKRLGGRLVFVTASSGSGCSDWGGSLWALWEVSGSKLTLRTDPDQTGSISPMCGVDLDGDGQLEILFDDGILRHWKDVEKLSFPDFDCPC